MFPNAFWKAKAFPIIGVIFHLCYDFLKNKYNKNIHANHLIFMKNSLKFMEKYLIFMEK
jgi:hypothetical protein